MVNVQGSHGDIMYQRVMWWWHREGTFDKVFGFWPSLGVSKVIKQFVIQSVSEESRLRKVNASEILPPFGRLNDIEKGFLLKIAIVIALKLGQNQSLRF